jgi:ubiquinone biosynthesis protein
LKSTSEFELPLSVMRERIGTSDLLPASYAGYRAVVADALHFFLQRLSAERLREIFVEQMRFAAAASTSERVVALLSHCPALHKLGPVLARDRRLSKSFRHHLQRLESLAPRVCLTSVTQIIDSASRNWRGADIKIGPRPLAEGSVAVIIPFEWVKRPGKSQQGVLKLLKPGVQLRLEEDLAILSLVAASLDEDCHHYGLPALDYQTAFQTVRELLLHEVHFEQEQKNLAEAARIYSQNRKVSIPALLPFCSADVTAMERLRGDPIPLEGGRNVEVRPTILARLIVESLVAHPIFSSEEAALFHADPHGGNLLQTSDGRLGILDWSLTGRLNRAERAAIVQLILAALALDPGQMAAALRELAHRAADPVEWTCVLESSLRQLRWGTFPGLGWVTRLLDALVMRGGVRFSSNLLLFRKSLLTLEGMLAGLLGEKESTLILDEAITAVFLNHWSSEWREFFLTSFNSRSNLTHMSKADLFAFGWSSAWTPARWWSQTALDFLHYWSPAKGPSGT